MGIEVTPEISLSESPKKGSANSYAFTGVELYLNKQFEEVDNGDLEDNPVMSGELKWMTMNIPYFMGAIIPLEGVTGNKASFRGASAGGIMTGTLVHPPVALQPNQSVTLKNLVFFGPRDLEILKPHGP